MNVKMFLGYPPRFKTKEDGLKYMECVKNRTPVPEEIWVWPFIEIKGVSWPNPEYKNAPYEANVV